jgi:hypothetical protein
VVVAFGSSHHLQWYEITSCSAVVVGQASGLDLWWSVFVSRWQQPPQKRSTGAPASNWLAAVAAAADDGISGICSQRGVVSDNTILKVKYEAVTEPAFAAFVVAAAAAR